MLHGERGVKWLWPLATGCVGVKRPSTKWLWRLATGYGAIESTHKHVLQRRMKLPGLAWSPQNAQRMATLLALQASVGPRAFYQHLEQHLAHAA